MNKIHVYKVVSVVLLAALLFAFNNCMPRVPGHKSSSSSTSGQSRTPSADHTEVPQTEEQVLTTLQVEVGVKNYEQLLKTYSHLTGVSATDSNIVRVYNEVQSSLPTENDVKVFAASHQVAITKLAAEFCNRLVENSTFRSAIWPNFPFTTIAGTALTPANRAFILQKAIERFWVVASEDDVREAEEEILPLIDVLLLSETNDQIATRAVVKGVCTMVLSSSHVTLL